MISKKIIKSEFVLVLFLGSFHSAKTFYNVNPTLGKGINKPRLMPGETWKNRQRQIFSGHDN